MTAFIIVLECKINVLKHGKLYKDAYILQELFAMTDKSYPPPCRNYLQPLYLSVTLYACAQRGDGFKDKCPASLQNDLEWKLK